MNFAHLLGDNLKIITWTLSLFVDLSAFSSLYALKQAVPLLLLLTLWTYITPVCGIGLSILSPSCNVSHNSSTWNSLHLPTLLQPWGWTCSSEAEGPWWWGLEMQKPKLNSECWVQGVIEHGHCDFSASFWVVHKEGRVILSEKRIPPPQHREFCYLLIMPRDMLLQKAASV